MLYAYDGLLQCHDASSAPGMLYPRDSESREIKSLDGMWKFRIDASRSRAEGLTQKWYTKPLEETGPVIPMPVPSSYNDITQEKSIRDFVGWAWYQREFYVSSSWKHNRIVLRLDSAHYFAVVWLNGKEVLTHEGGHLPFEGAVKSFLNFDKANVITVAVNNTLTPTTLPPGDIIYKQNTTHGLPYPAGYFVQYYQFDFFNFAGIHRSVRLYTTPVCYVDDIDITTNIQGSTGLVKYSVSSLGVCQTNSVMVAILDKWGNVVAQGADYQGTIQVPNAKLWWPYDMSKEDHAYLYTMKVSVKTNVTTEGNIDIYRLPFGIRTVRVEQGQVLVNGKPFYCHGFGKHEDADIRGKGLDFPLIAKDFNLIKWVGANCFRTSHYPYAEEIMDQADQQGVMVIDESPGVGITKVASYGPVSLAHHKEVMFELIRRDKNRPSVFMWSVANEPNSIIPQAHSYFREVINYTRSLDPRRPITYAVGGGADYYSDVCAILVDIICINHYFGWYSDTGHLEVIQLQLENDLVNWYKTFKKPMIITEYGADTIAGLHMEPSFVFSEEYQVDFIKEYHRSFDKLRKQFLVGELIWNFADFLTVQGVKRVAGNKKGIFTRQRQPKMAAHSLRERYLSLNNETKGY
ncbi:beta-glucuronidase-like isoform X2 [Lineus longissimus]|uniref:beta-glucuronidase-like isoform X2 n=1 Tax=Lineus longissimus TaxID=88925 RepID=UPI00315C7716